MNKESINTRVLIIDDEEIVRDNIEEILMPNKQQQNESISAASSILFDDEPADHILTTVNNDNIPVFEVDKAINGMEGVEKIKEAIANERPYAVIFLDMRMPMGWPGNSIAYQTSRYQSRDHHHYRL